MLRLFKKYVDAHDYNFSSSDSDSRLFWNYYRLKENCKKVYYWKSSGKCISPNQSSMEVLVECYLQLCSEINESLDAEESKLLNQIINKFYEQLRMRTSPNPNYHTESRLHLGHLGLHG